MGVTHIHSDGEFRALLENNQPGGSSDNLFLVDYSAKWCGPCNIIAPVFESLSNKYGHQNFQFVHVDVDECGDVAQEQGVRAMPTFVFYKNSTLSELSRIQGADATSLENKIKELGPKFQAHFGGEGNRLGGSGARNSGTEVGSSAASSLSPEEVIQIAQSTIEYGLSTCSRVGVRFQPPIKALGTTKPMVRINGSDKVCKLRDFVDSIVVTCCGGSAEDAGNRNSARGSPRAYELHNSYPPGKLDEDKTVSDAGIAGAVVVVKFV